MGREILPHEREVRSWLRRHVAGGLDQEDIVQECYCRIAQLRDVTHVVQPRAYFFSIARNLVAQRFRAARVVRIEAIAELSTELESDDPSPERIVAARHELGLVHTALANLPDRARRIFIMRRINGLTQKEIAQALNVTESIVENDASRSLRAVLRALTEPVTLDMPASQTEGSGRVRSR